MGTRCGDLDPSLLEYIAYKEGLSLDEIDNVLNKQSGLLGISGLTGDMRELLAEVEEHDDRRARLAIEIFCRPRAQVRRRLLRRAGGRRRGGLRGRDRRERARDPRAHLRGARVARAEPRSGPQPRSSSPGARVRSRPTRAASSAWVIPTDEELMIARDTVRVLG